MNADSLDINIPLSHLARWGETTAATLAPTGGPSFEGLAPYLVIAALLIVGTVVGLVFLGSWAWRGFP